MSVYLYKLPTTGTISFTDFCVDVTPEGVYRSHISEATQARANLRDALKENKRNDRDEKDYLRLVKTLDDYVPFLYGIIGCVAAWEIHLKSQPIFSWRTTLSSHMFNTSPRISLPSLQADLASSLLTYGFALSNLSRSTVIALGSYERQRAISDIERKVKDEKLNFAVTLLCRASGMFTFISDHIPLEWEGTGDKDGILSKFPDLRKEVSAALAKLALADAQSLAIRKLLSRSAYDSTITPGPPLPKSHPSPVLIAKLHLECMALYSSARALAMIPGKSKSPNSSNSDGEVSLELKRYLADEATFHGALARKWLGADAGEAGSSRGGEAVGFLLWAKKDLEELKDGGKSVIVGNERELKEWRKAKVLEELESVDVFLKHYKKANDTLYFQPVQPQTDLQAKIPAGRLAVAVKPYVQPPPAFGPNSVEYARRKEELKDGVADERIEGEHSDASRDVSSQSTQFGSYF